MVSNDRPYLPRTIAIAPGLQLVNPQPLASQDIQAVVGALSESRHGFTALPAVELEVSQIQQLVKSKILLNQQFLEASLQQTVNTVPFPIVHLATHGQFSSNADDTFILAWDRMLDVNTLSDLLQSSEFFRGVPIELLILSACETATGDDRAALGLAGVAVRAGARSTLASLWQVDDEGTSILISQFYQDLGQLQATKAEALRQAQLRLLEDPTYSHPYFWSPCVLVGNWL